MAFARDVDLLVLEPGLFRDMGLASQKVIEGVAKVQSGALMLVSASGDFESAGVGAGGVVVLGGKTYEVVSRAGPTELEVSLVRARAEDPPVYPADTSNEAFVVWTFLPQIELAHRELMRSAGVAVGAGGPSPAVTNAPELVHVESLLALRTILSALGAPGGAGSPASQRGEWYARRYEAERARVVVEVDLDGDGVGEARRALGSRTLTRG